MGEPGAPNELQLNQPITHYLHGSKYLIGFDSRWGRLRVASLDPVSTPWQLATAAAGSIKGKTSPFDRHDRPVLGPWDVMAAEDSTAGGRRKPPAAPGISASGRRILPAPWVSTR